MTRVTQFSGRIALIAVSAGSAYWILALTLSDTQIAPQSTTTASAPDLPITLQTLQPSLPTVGTRAVLERPLFHWSRRPLLSRPSNPVAEMQTQIATVPPLILRGVMLSRRGYRALLQRDGTDTYVQVTQGMELDGCNVQSIEARRAVLLCGSRDIGIDLVEPIKAP